MSLHFEQKHPATASPIRRDRRSVLRAGLLAGVGLVGAAACAPSAPAPPAGTGRAPDPTATGSAEAALADLERRDRVRLGVCAVDTATGAVVGNRADERVLMCSTSKLLTVSAVLLQRLRRPGLLDQVVRYGPERLVPNSPTTGAHVADGLTVAAIAEAAMTRSDNTAENLLLDLVGGPAGQTAFLRSIGDTVSRSDRYETDLNVDAPGDLDTSTPRQMADNLRRLALGDVLDPQGRSLLEGWLVANTTGGTRLRGGLPAGWRTGDKTGTGAQGELNDVAFTGPPGRPPLVIAAYVRPLDPRAPEDGTAATMRASATIVARAFVPGA